MGISPATFCTWGPGTGATAFGGAAQFTNGSGSTITLESRLPNLFGNNGDYIDFELFQATASAWTVFGSTVTQDAIVVNDDEITVTDGTTTATLALDASLSTTAWSHIEIYRESDTLKCRVNGFVQAGTDTPVPVGIDIIGKNQAAYTDVIAVKLAGFDGDYLSKASPTTAVQGANTGFWRNGWFYLDSVGNHTIADCLNGNNGWRIEVENVYQSAHRLKFSIGNGTEVVTLSSTETFSTEQWVNFHVDLEDLNGGDPDEGDTTVDGTFTPETGNFYVGATRGTSNFFDGKIDSLYGGDGALTSGQVTWLYNSGLGRVVDEITGVTTVSTSHVDFGWGFDQTTGTRLDDFGSDDLTENAGSPFSDGFEAVTGGAFDNWSTTEAGSTTVNVDSSNQRTGTYCARVDVDGSDSDGSVVSSVMASLTTGKEYTVSVYAGATATGPSFRIQVGTSGESSDKTISATAYTEYTYTFTDFGTNLRLIVRSGANESVYFDDVTISSSSIISAVGLQSTHTTAAVFTGYLKNVKMSAAAGFVSLPLRTNANDIGGDSNEGTAINVTFATTDPGA